MTRRFFIFGAGLAPGIRRATGANDRIRLGFIGAGNRARWLITNEEFPGAEIVALADCDLPRCYERAKIRPEGEHWAKYQDYRRMLDKEKLDAVFVTTTTHARVLACIHAMQTGLDVYAEKPLTLTVEEGRALVRAADRHKRVFQTGTQARSIPINIYACRLIRSGAIGKVHTVTTSTFQPFRIWTPKSEQPGPDGLDWDLWCNQTELRPYHRELHFNWSIWRDYDGAGQTFGVTGWGAHAFDQVQHGLGTDDAGPVEVWPEEGGQQARVTMRYANGTLLKLQDPVTSNHAQLGATFFGDNGRIQVWRGTLVSDRPELIKEAPDTVQEGPGENSYHIRNFLDCMRTRRRPTADAEVGHRATTICHLVNMCRETGRQLRWDPRRETLVGDAQTSVFLRRARRKGYELPWV